MDACANKQLNFKLLSYQFHYLTSIGVSSVTTLKVVSTLGLNSIEAHKIRLQRLQNIAARMITYTKKTEHITPVLAGLHWLPIQQRVKYKLCLIIFKILQGDAPAYLSDLLQIYTPGHRGLRSTKHKFLQEKTTKHVWGERSFQSAAPKLWNSLPDTVKLSKSLNTFKNSLKTHFHREAFC